MAKREVFHVTKDGDTWQVKKRGAKRASSRHDTKADAVERGRQLAKRTGLGQLIVHKQDGKIQTEYTYGNDPRRSKG